MSETASQDSRELVLDGQMDPAEAGALLAPVAFADWPAAYRCLQRLATTPSQRQALAECVPHLLAALENAANPDRVLANLERLAAGSDDPLSLFRYLAGTPRAIAMLVTLFAGSQFLTEILLRNPDYVARLSDRRRLARLKTVDELFRDLRAIVAQADDNDEALDVLRRYQRWELLRIGAGDLFDLLDVASATAQLSHLADSLVQVCLDIAADETGQPADSMTVIAMGKLGGEELNYSSDIDLIFLAGEDADRCRRLGESLIDALSRVTAEGFLYRVDMRLRPWGNDGVLVSSLNGHISYLRQHARLWEKQALLKARCIAGSQVLGESFLERVEPILFDMSGPSVRADIHAMKQRTESYLQQRGRGWGEVKLGVGSIRDVEFVAQYLQLEHGGLHPEVRSRNTLDGLERLSVAGLLSADDYRVLSDGYVLLRTIEHHLQVMDYRQTATLPDDSQAQFQLAQRLGFQGEDAGEQFLARYQQHCAAIRLVYQQFLGSSDMNQPEGAEAGAEAPADQREAPGNQVHSHLSRMVPSYQDTFDQDEIEQHVILANQLDRENLVEVRAVPTGDGLERVTIVAYDYPGELSLICGLLFVYGFSILDGHVFTYEALELEDQALPRPPIGRRRKRPSPGPQRSDTRRKIVDVFNVKRVAEDSGPGLWAMYRDDLAELLQLMNAGQRREARGKLVKRVAAMLRDMESSPRTLYPAQIEIDNESSDRYTVLDIDAPDTIGFLYEFANGLAINHIYIAQMTVDSVGNQVRDTLHVTDEQGRKITSPEQIRELRAATVLIKHFTHLLPSSPDPETALLHFREFLVQLFKRPNWPDELASLERHEVLDAMARLLGVSEFLWDDFLRMQYANLFPVVTDVDDLATPKSKEWLDATLKAGMEAAPDDQARRDVINAFKDREMFRIDMRYILGHVSEFGQFSAELTTLTEVVLEATFYLCEEELRARYGVPCLEDGQPSTMSVCALGKCGGREMGFASDIELMFIFDGNGLTSGPEVITSAEFYEKLVQTFIGIIQAKREGIFEIDLRLRPYGRAGSMAVPLDAFKRYFAPDGDAWDYERQALIKLRPIAGGTGLGRRVVTLRDQFVYSDQPFDVAAMHAMRERQIRHLVTGGTINAKVSPGGLVDLEYLVQGLQINYGHQDPTLRLNHTGQAIAALASAGILSLEEYVEMREALAFLRRLINALRMVRGSARDLTVPPPESEEFAFLAHRLGYGNDVQQLRDDLTRHMTQVQALSRRLLLSRRDEQPAGDA